MRKARAKVVRIFWWVVVVGLDAVDDLGVFLDAVGGFGFGLDPFDFGVGVEVSRMRLPGVLGPGMVCFVWLFVCV